jgi:hypothetical protein
MSRLGKKIRSRRHSPGPLILVDTKQVTELDWDRRKDLTEADYAHLAWQDEHKADVMDAHNRRTGRKTGFSMTHLPAGAYERIFGKRKRTA